MIEVEVKAKIDDFKEMEERLSKIGAAKSKNEFQEDIYFASPIVDFAQTGNVHWGEQFLLRGKRMQICIQ